VPSTELPAKLLIASALREIAGPVLDGVLEGDISKLEITTSTGVRACFAIAEDEPERTLDPATSWPFPNKP